MTGIEHYPAEAVAVAKSRGYDEQAHIKAIGDDRDDDISLTHPANWLTEAEVTDLWDVA